MKLKAITGTIERRVLINYRVDPDVVAAILPPPFKPAIVGDYAIAGICLIQLRVRPIWLPRAVGFRSFNGAHRIAATLPDGGDVVYIPRRETDSKLNALVGGRLFPGTYQHATITAQDSGDRFKVNLSSRDGTTSVAVTATTADHLPEASVFTSVRQASDFFKRGSFGYSDTPRGDVYDVIELQTRNWSATPLAVEHVESSFFNDPALFPAGTAEVDHALLMRDIQHTWHTRPQLETESRALIAAA